MGGGMKWVKEDGNGERVGRKGGREGDSERRF